MGLPVATHSGYVKVGNWELRAFNLEDGRRMFDKTSFKTVLHVSPNTRGTESLGLISRHPLLKRRSAAAKLFDHPTRFKAPDGKILLGFEAEGLVELCKFLLKAREIGALRTLEHMRYAQAAEALLVSLANVGLAALIDEATGYQASRSRDALQAMLERYLKKELSAWAKRFPDDFYEQLFRLRRWKWKGRTANPPQIVGKYTRDIVYERLAPGIIEELERRNPICESGERKNRHHQWLTEDIGHPALAQHLYAVIALMRVSQNWTKFMFNLQEAFPKKGDSLYLFPVD